jgi:regulatory protein
LQVTFRAKEGNKERWEIFIDGEKWREVHRAIFGRKPAFPTFSFSSEADLQVTFDDFEHRRVKGYVLWRLSNQSYHSEQLAKLLRDRLVQDKTIACILGECHELGILDDESWLKSFLRVQQKHCGIRLIINKLRAKGLSEESLQDIANQWNDPDGELRTIQQLLQTRYRSKNLTEDKSRQKVIGSLMRKGYRYEQIQAAIQQFNDKE